MADYPKIIPLWDVLEVAYQQQDGGKITLFFDHDELTPDYDLLQIRRVAGRGTSWPYMYCTSTTPHQLTLRLGYDENNLQSITVDTQQPQHTLHLTANNGIPVTIDLQLVCDTLQLLEYDEYYDEEYTYVVDIYDYEDATQHEDAQAAFRIAESLEEQTPEVLTIVAKYMEYAADLGSQEANEWLQDYHSDDGRWDAWS